MENGKHPQPMEMKQEKPPAPAPMKKILAVTGIAAGVQFGWALQFSLLTPYVQLLGIPHRWASFIWLCGPISGLVVQPLAGYYSDRCTSRFGRRRPFIAVAAAFVVMAAILIGFAADFGRLGGDPLGDTAKPRAIAIFVVGFWIFDVANNLLMAPCRALLADLSGDNHRRTRNANATYSFFTAVGSVLGYAAGSYSRLHNLLPFTSTEACNVYCANLKSCFLISVTLLLTVTILALIIVREIPISKAEQDIEEKKGIKTVPFFGDLISALKQFPKPMWMLLLVMALASVAWFGFLLYDTDWMGREVYGGKVGNALYASGVHAGSLGLMLMAAVAGVTSLGVVFLVRGVRGGNLMWGTTNILLAICLALTVLISKESESVRRHGSVGGGPSVGVKAGALTLFAILGVPQAITFTIPYALAATFSATANIGQGLTMGVLNVAIVVPQLAVSLSSGPWDEVFGGGNLPSFVVGAIAATVGGVLALTLLPSPPPTSLDISSSTATAAAASH
ncbi:hypothetical protein NMG60_11017485 [Bertholletia excelsa]